MVTYIVNGKWYTEKKQDTECIVLAAAKIIRAEIRETDSETLDGLLTEYFPGTFTQ